MSETRMEAPPHDRDAERAVLGALLRNNSLYRTLADFVLDSDWYVYAHRIVWLAAAAILADGGTADLVTMANYLRRRKDRETQKNLLAEVGGPVYLAELWEAAPAARDPLEYARIIREHSAVREVLRACTVLNQEGRDGPANLERLQSVVDRLKFRLDAARGSDRPRRKVGTLLSEVIEEEVSWLWLNRIPLGMITVLDGDPGKGKSMMTMDLASRITTGNDMPDGTIGLDGGVVVLNAEDDMAKTILPRIIAAGGDPSRIKVIGTVPIDGKSGERLVTLPEDIPLIRDAVREMDAKLVIIDPIMSYLGELRGNSDQDVRAALLPLKEMAAQEQVAVVLVRHLNKTVGSNALYRGSGSIGFVGVARQALIVAEDPDNPLHRVVAVTKSNLGGYATSLVFGIDTDCEGRARVGWMGESSHNADALVAAPKEGDDDKSHVQEACDILAELLKDGPKPMNELKQEASAAGVSVALLRRAKCMLQIKAIKQGFGKDGVWTWCLPAPKEGKGKKGT